MIVADTNLLVYLLLPGEHSGAAESAYRADPNWSAPLLWRSEFRNVLSVYVRRGDLEFDAALDAFRAAESIVQGREFAVETQEVLELAGMSSFSAYDCEYLVLARELDVPLVTSDREMLEEFPEVAIAIEEFEPEESS